MKKAFDRYGKSIGGKLATFLATGNALSTTGLDLMQVSGFTIQAERINMLRYDRSHTHMSYVIIMHLLRGI